MADDPEPTIRLFGDEDGLRALMERARAGDESALPALREAFDESPAVWRAYGDLAGHLKSLWIGRIAGDDVALAEALRRRAEDLRAEVAGPAPSPLERLLADRVVASAIEVWHADAAAAGAGEAQSKWSTFLRRRQDAAHRRHLAAIRGLATVRKLIPPAGPTTTGEAVKDSKPPPPVGRR